MLFRPTARPQPACLHLASQQIRHATLIRRPKRPYTFTQLITLSDGSTFVHRTTSPQPVYRSTKDTKNSALWNPSSQKLLNVEEDEAGRLRRFRRRFGRGYDVDAGEETSEADTAEGTQQQPTEDENLLDLISAYGREANTQGEAAGAQEEKTKGGKKKSGEK